MFNHLFPIFCFGLLITGIVYLGIIEASKQAKIESGNERDPAVHDIKPSAELPRPHHP